MVWDHQKPLIFLLIFHRFFMCFQNRSLGPFLEGPSAELLWKVRFWCHFRFQDFQKDTFWRPFWATTASKIEYPSWGWASFSRPCFSRNRSNYCVVRTHWFLKGHFSDGDWLIFDLLYICLCYVLYNIFITFVHKTSVNTQTSSPPFFEKNTPHNKKICCFWFRCLRLHFFYFFVFVLIFGYLFHICVDFRVHSPPPPWARIGRKRFNKSSSRYVFCSPVGPTRPENTHTTHNPTIHETWMWNNLRRICNSTFRNFDSDLTEFLKPYFPKTHTTEFVSQQKPTPWTTTIFYRYMRTIGWYQ